MQVGTNKNFYELLGVPRDATREQIQAAYREVARIYHPDSNFYSEILDEVGVEFRPEQIAMFDAVTQAYKVLSDEVRRDDYDRTLSPEERGWEEDINVHDGGDATVNFVAMDSSINYRPSKSKSHAMAFGTFGRVSDRDKESSNDPDVMNATLLHKVQIASKVDNRTVNPLTSVDGSVVKERVRKTTTSLTLKRRGIVDKLLPFLYLGVGVLAGLAIILYVL